MLIVNIREIKEDDAENHLSLCIKLDNETKFMLYEPGERTTTVERQREFVHSQITSEDSTIFVVEHENQLVGHLIVNGGKVKRIKHVGYLVVGILKEYTGQGIGTGLFNALENWRIGTGIKRLELSVMVHNEAAVSLYKKMGFEIEGIKKKSLIIDGKYIDEYYMGKTFE
ncbi:GCN5 family acetyltransferase [Paenibacillus antarcticus]|uniref:GCN5 family acetyltransferase n=1 Tax=Paenibacillus antarcticus TaxID=253703 RepID=A0A168KQX8_9BACL|nr:GCN5 family acetyltransferase [Paenibacillus antarcticus]